ncbi:gamma-glutamyl-gamma-aminobutyrate hydrolase family protein, partial [uncultured Salegentibacter sp.]
ILVAPGFGERGVEGKIDAVKYARERNLPFLGICLGMQMAVIEFARNVLKLKTANSTEMDPKTKHPVIDLMEEQKEVTHKGGTMRLGAWDCKLTEGSKIYKAYGKSEIKERHRHRYEYNNKYKEELEKAGMLSTGINPETGLVEVIELKDHPWFVGVQYHPEYKSTVATPHPVFIAFIKAAFDFSKKRKNASLAQK